jgi:hypothetical protein
MAMEIGADGALYLLEWGGDNNHWFNQKDGILSRMEYQGRCNDASSSILDRSGPGPAGEGRLLPILDRTTALLPPRASGLELYDLAGVRCWAYRPGRGFRASRVALPAGLPPGILYAKFLAD